jgi:sugar lactone lactonase YvrE
LNYPFRVVVDSKDNVFIADQNNCLIRKVTGGTISTVAGKSPTLGCGYAGDKGPAKAAELDYPDGVALDKSGNLYISDYYNQVIRVVSCLTVTSTGGTCTPKAGETAGDIYTFAGDNALPAGFSGDGGPATSAQLYYPYDVAVDAFGNVYIADYYNMRVRKVNTSGIISTFAGNGNNGYQVDSVPATDTGLSYPAGVGVDGAGDILIGDQNDERVRLVDGEGNIHTIAGDGISGFGGEGYDGNDILATKAELYSPRGVTVDPSGNIYVADYSNDLVREITAPITLNASVPSISFDTQTINTTSDAVAFTLSANGTADITSITSSAGFLEVDDCPTALTSGSTCLVNVRFSPTTDGVINGTLTIKYNGFLTASLVVPLQGEGSGLSISPVSLGFGTQLVTAAATTKTVTVTGKTTYSSPSATLDGSAAFTIASNTCTGAITTSCAIGIAFAPTSATLGGLKSTLIIHDNDPTNPQLLALTGTGTEVTLTPTTLAFGTVASGSKSLSVTVKNVGTTVLSFTSAPTITGTGSTNFTVLPYSATGPQSTCLNGTVTLAQNASCTYTVQFTFAGGTTAFTTDLNIFDNGGASPQVVVMTATD